MKTSSAYGLEGFHTFLDLRRLGECMEGQGMKTSFAYGLEGFHTLYLSRSG
jgi:hypothetical protein